MTAPARELSRAEAALPLPESRRVKLLALRPGFCKWPIGDPQDQGFCYCGADTGDVARVYCPTHRRLGTVPRAAQPTKGGAR